MNIELKSNVVKDEYTDYIQEAFDLKVEDVQTTLIPNNLHLNRLHDWNIGVICGASGSGKSSILKSLGEIKTPSFDNDKTLISNFDNMTPEEATKLLSSMGLASVPTWIRPFRVLSNGEQYRASLAKVLADSKDGEIILVDEYTSVVDRNVAKSMSNALQKYIRRTNKQIILATCHYDIFDWLQPDWIYDLNKGGTLEKGDCLRQRPKIELQVYRTTYNAWDFFKKHHYMTQELNNSAHCLVFTWNNQMVAFCALLTQPSGTLKNAWRISRLVVLPDFQGLGIGSKVSDFIGAIFKSVGRRLFIKTVNPGLGESFGASNLWKGSTHNGKPRNIKHRERNTFKHAFNRASYCFEYVGEPLYGYDELLKSTDELREEKSMEGQLSLF